MESTVEENSKGIDASVGGLVWVRRRNGSWWPGRIMGLDELSETCLVSPRSGTPVKLLGREDASVDWYNIEKSKRVKAFRCGEYDECIEKAKASAALANKKAVKYARREDAILHALDLESARKIMEHQAFCSRTENSIGKSIGLGKEKRAYVGNFNMLEENSAQELSQSVVSFEQTNHASAPNIHFIHKSKRKTPNDSEDDGTEGTKRMRGLQDLVPPDSASLSEPNIGNSLSNGIPVNNSKGCCSILKRRRSQVSQVHESFKRKNRRRPLTKVLESTAKVDITGFCDANTGLFALEVITESKNGAMESTESKKTSSSTVIDNNSNCTETSCEKENSLNDSRRICDDGVDAVHWYSNTKDNTFPGMLEFPNNDCSVSILNAHSVKEENRNGVFSDAFASCASRKLRSGAAGRRSSHSNRNEPKSLRKGLDEVGSTSFSYVANNVKQRTEKNASKWQSKRKRNSGYLSKKTSENPYSRHFFMYGANRSHRRKNGLSIGFYSKVDNNSFEESLTSDNDDGDQVFDTHDQISDGLASHSLKSTMRKSASQTRKKASFLARGLPVLSGIHQRSNFHCQYLVPENPKAGASIGFPLFDVNLDVRGSYQGQHVPLVSLMSKLNGKAIIGHPITVEVLEDGYYEFLMSSINHHPASNNAGLYNIPRIEENASEQSADIFNPSIALGGSDDALGTCENASSSLSKKSPKNRRCGFLSQKTRKLSSIAVDHELKDEERNPVVAKLGEPVIACVPVKIVFSRIKEAVSCSARPANRILTSNPL